MRPLNLHDYEALAKERIDPLAWAFLAGGSDDELTLRANRTAFERILLRPRMLVDVSRCDIGTTVLGIPVRAPVLIAPTAAHALAHPAEAECATAIAAADAGTIMIVSTSATRTIEQIAAAARGPLWFQLYIRNWSHARTLVERAVAAGYQAIVLTVDRPLLGNRDRDVRGGFGGFARAHDADDGLPYIGDTLTWDVLGWLRSICALPVLVKGVLTAEDALLAVEHGAAGIVVSNHGGRQLDGVVPSIVALPEVCAAVAGRCEVYLDGGVRRGTDVLKALALGARAVLVGRPVLWGLAVDGADGVRHVLAILAAELKRAMILAGQPALGSINRTLVRLQYYLDG
ncbi:MAG: alpha-hydroxy-acid oxidizing protein [Chloroflexales bacterium]|nr:alpha-hydroxy-acid oxidizing protein [Chloroflexales bacterium]